MNRPSRFLLVFAAAAGLPLLGGIAPGLPVVGARPVLAVAQEVSAPEAASTSRLVPAITLPAGAMRLNDAGALGELKTQLTTVAKEGGFGISKIEALIWGGNGHDAARNKSVQNALKQAFTKAGYRHETVGEKKTDDGVVTIFLAGKESTKQAVLGFFVASDNYLVLAWGQMTPQQNGAKNADEEPAAAAKPGNSAANTTKRPASAEQKRLDAELLAAISEDNVDAVKTLLKQGADPNGRTGEFRHAILMPAVRRGNKDVVAALLRAGADPDYGDGTNVTPLYIAAVLGEAETVQALLDGGAKVNAAVPADGQTPLHGAALTGRAEVTKLLLEHGADKSKRDKSGKTALDIAAAQKDNPVADLLR